MGGRPGAGARERLLRESMAAWNRGDLDGWLATFDADAEWVPYLAVLEAKSYRGYDGLKEVWLGQHEQFAKLEVHPLEIMELQDSVLTRLEFRARGAGSGAELRQELWQVCEFRGDKIVRIAMFRDEKAARTESGAAS